MLVQYLGQGHSVLTRTLKQNHSIYYSILEKSIAYVVLHRQHDQCLRIKTHPLPKAVKDEKELKWSSKDFISTSGLSQVRLSASEDLKAWYHLCFNRFIIQMDSGKQQLHSLISSCSFHRVTSCQHIYSEHPLLFLLLFTNRQP